MVCDGGRKVELELMIYTYQDAGGPSLLDPLYARVTCRADATQRDRFVVARLSMATLRC